MNSPSSSPSSPPPFPLRDLHIDMLTECARQLDPASLLSFAAVCSAFSRAAEVVFRERCLDRRWSLPRRPRGAEALAAAAGPHASWRALYRRRICGACSGHPGEFQAFERRGGGGGTGGGEASKLRYLLCAKCVRRPGVSGRLAALNLRLDLVGLSGRRLLSEAEERSAFGGGGRRRGRRGRGRGGGGGGGGRGGRGAARASAVR